MQEHNLKTTTGCLCKITIFKTRPFLVYSREVLSNEEADLRESDDQPGMG